MDAFRKRKTINSQTKFHNTAWRKYQFRLRQKSAARQALRRLPAYLLILCIGLGLIKGGFFVAHWFQSRPLPQQAAVKPETERVTRDEVRALLDRSDLLNPLTPVFSKKIAGRDCALHTTLNEDLQKAVLSMMDPKYARQIGIVVMDARTGKILVMASHDRNNPDMNNCTNASFPAASLFKIVSAAGAIDDSGLTPETRMSFNGGKYTLYRSQLADTKNKYTNYVTLEKAFAESINPVFGKIGQNYLDKARLEKYAQAFWFNREMDFDLPVDVSVASVSEKPYNWAEIACGFNKTTQISALHAAMLSAAIVHNGAMMRPYFIERAVLNDRVVFRQDRKMLTRSIHPETARQMQSMMNAAVTRGTARGSFRGRQATAIFKRFDVGGKTGSINDNPAKVKFDWFTGYARHRETGNTIAVGVIVAHKNYIGVRAAEYFRRIVYEYMQQPLNQAKAPQDAVNDDT
ncbi:cell division protein FtsI/penicillin-binding protein 2 [Desulfosalsimonas propionicica]|uniref:Cell division protein FtsI/penicillin-binding protein 2 n=1 Tax=Desulfosalsimonas propionicica TaxID=332175 RepID=A0A7W0C7S7_9BACT|nr:penicillin-binding transpeptidase domain-containing protein [Desulfosalsimonas propionicica]MBA2880756.1 cell division protein FtsI/penicillin-binding protein 2 [Desulfosalsimonas propionicica]